MYTLYELEKHAGKTNVQEEQQLRSGNYSAEIY